ncbi:unnamed protein product [Rotaria sp. Silwood2]|nr:unnamed protein product [Rotaria sp. Silwood2]
MDTIVSGPTEHHHTPTPDLVPVLELKNKIKTRAAKTEELPSTILHSVMRSFPLDAANQLPQSETLLRTIRRQRPAPSMTANNQLPDHLKQTDPFVPVLDVIKAFDLVADDFDDEADDFLGYFKKTWIGEPKKRGTGRKKPLFPIELWNVYDRTVANLPRSNNSIEGWHNAFAKRVAIAHPSISKLTEKIRREQSKFEVDIAQIPQG